MIYLTFRFRFETWVSSINLIILSERLDHFVFQLLYLFHHNHVINAYCKKKYIKRLCIFFNLNFIRKILIIDNLNI